MHNAKLSKKLKSSCAFCWDVPPVKNFLLYFGTNTIWYLQFQLVCAKLFVLFILNVLLLVFSLQLSGRTLILSKGVFISYSSLKLFLNPRTAGGSYNNNAPSRRIIGLQKGALLLFAGFT